MNARPAASVQVFGRRDYGLTTDCGGRRPKSAKARSRGQLGTGWQRALLGFRYQPRTRLRSGRRLAGCINGTIGKLMDRIGSRGGNPDRRTLPQLLRFGMNVAKEWGFHLSGLCDFK